ncbi:MAG: M48 family metalloprotease [Pseudomonadales bacterium]|nr:M48 family metalloprotease [Pseudomonadales bacterium]MCP5344526.1 M48 family metalloprotease [Pseudomonadales bacterium]
MSSNRPSFSLRSGFARTASVLTLLGVALVLSSCAVNPATGQANIVTMSEKRELEIGAEEHAKVMSSMPLVEDESLTAYINEVGQRLAAVSDRPDLTYTFTVIDSPEINAFALPGGYVYVNRGLLAYLNSEAELAAVIGHEIGHITARHAVQQQSRGALARVASGVGGVVAAVATGSGYIGSQIMDVGSLWAQAGLSGFGREHELEADTLGAEYLLRAGYDPQAVIKVVTVLKNQEDFNTKVANQQPSYHGLFATHPRNDTRLQQAIASVGALPASQATLVDNAGFRDHMDGLVVGESQRITGSQARNRYYQTLLGYTMVFPDDWTVSETPTTVSATNPAGDSGLRVEVQRMQESLEPRLFIRDKLGISNLQKTEPLQQYRLQGYTGTTNTDGKSQRIAVIYLGPRVFIFTGDIAAGEGAEASDQLLLAAIRTFRAIQANERFSGNESHIRYVQVGEGFTFAALARMSPIANYPEETLRLINGYYPTGTPNPGDWIKIVE